MILQGYTCEQCFSYIVEHIRIAVKQAGFSKCVLGVSGGIDSALVLSLAIEALGKENVLPVFLPSPYTSTLSRTIVEELSNTFSITIPTFPIHTILGTLEATFLDTAKEPLSGIPLENVQPRIRSVVLMAYANMYDALLLSSANKSERLVGFCTIYGDTCGALAPIGDIFKSDVYAITQWYSATHTALPPALHTRAPSAELAFDQYDTDRLPPYSVLDPILVHLLQKGVIEERTSCQYTQYTQEMLVSMGVSAALLDAVIKLYERARFKQLQSAPSIIIP